MGTVVNGANLDSSILTAANAATTLTSYVQVPVVLGGVGMMYNLPSLNAKYKKTPVILNSAILAGMYDGAITKWNNPAICHLNPKIAKLTKNKKGRVIRRTCALPNIAVVPVYRADGSGTTFIFMNYLNATQGANFKTSSGTEVYPNTTFNQGEVPSNGLGGQKNAGVAADVEQTVGGIGYVEYSYILLQHTLPAALIVNARGKDVAVNPTTVAADAASFSATPPSETGTGVVSKFLDWCVQSGSQGGQTVAQQQGYVPLPSYVAALAEHQVSLMTYNGQSLGLS
jgi:ABC-type phosphate transport system substrate-binding protein